jgi:hypothetical protein
MMDMEERRGRDIWDRVNGYRTMAAEKPKPPKPIMEWPRHYPPHPPQNPSPGNPISDRPHLRGPVLPKPKPIQPPKPKPQPTGTGSAGAYDDPKSRDELLRGAYQAGLNGDMGAASSFPRGSAWEQAYRRGLADRDKRKKSMARYRPEAG